MNAPEHRFLEKKDAAHAEYRPAPIAPPFAAPLQDASHIGQAIARPNIARLAEGRGQYVDDLELPRMAYVVFWRSPVAHARITGIERDFARLMPGVLAVYDGNDLATICKP